MLTVVVCAPHVTLIQDFVSNWTKGWTGWRETVDHLVINNKMSTCLQYLLYLQYYLSRVTPTHICKSFSLKMKFIFALVVAESLQKFFNGASYHPTYHNNMKHFIHYILHYVKILGFITQLCNRFTIRRTIILVLLFGINFLNQHSTYNMCVFWSNKNQK